VHHARGCREPGTARFHHGLVGLRHSQKRSPPVYRIGDSQDHHRNRNDPTIPLDSATDNRARQTTSAQGCVSRKAKVTLVYDQALPNVQARASGACCRICAWRVSPAHSPSKSAFIYATVLAGAIRSQVNDGPGNEYRAAKVSPISRDRHSVSANASPRSPRGCLPCHRRYAREGSDNPLEK